MREIDERYIVIRCQLHIATLHARTATCTIYFPCRVRESSSVYIYVYVGVRSVGGACQPPPPHTPQTQTLPHTLSQEATNWGQRTRTSVWIRDSLQQHSQATLSLRESLSLSRHHLIYTSTHSHTHNHRTLLQSIFPYLSLFSCHETVSLRARNAVRSTVSQSPQHVSPAVFVTGRH